PRARGGTSEGDAEASVTLPADLDYLNDIAVRIQAVKRAIAPRHYGNRLKNFYVMSSESAVNRVKVADMNFDAVAPRSLFPCRFINGNRPPRKLGRVVLFNERHRTKGDEPRRFPNWRNPKHFTIEVRRGLKPRAG